MILVKRLLDNGASLTEVDSLAMEATPLHLAARYGHIKITKMFLEKGAEIGARTLDGWTPLHDAAYNDHTEIINILLDAHVDVDIRTAQEETPFILASMRGKVEAMRLLLQKGANLNARTDKKWTALHHALCGDVQESVDVILNEASTLTGGQAPDIEARTESGWVCHQPLHWPYYANDFADSFARSVIAWKSRYGGHARIIRCRSRFKRR